MASKRIEEDPAKKVPSRTGMPTSGFNNKRNIDVIHFEDPHQNKRQCSRQLAKSVVFGD
jgi:hypothetical protein